jgi:hypothetical protein
MLGQKFHSYLYHGTSSNHIDSIRKEGLQPGSGGVHVTTDAQIAHQEAHNTVSGEEEDLGTAAGYKKGVGGKPVIAIIDRNHPSVRGFKHDTEFDTTGPGGRVYPSASEFYTPQPIHPDAIKGFAPVHPDRWAGRQHTAHNLGRLGYASRKDKS